ncbi:restriction endonuclease [Niallia sp. MER 6]|uniref:restriction endonuclease n=1 Tax=Niallia sp. MER 6 TaxID=2939567 RepID=UPI00203EC8D8|nr:restriction endonuclease [Niallia sp. MER 6]MCM3034242.1 restriction endonuclease [Niallia sp. MER 6]
MIAIELIAGIILVMAFIHYLYTKRNNEYKVSLVVNHLNTSDEIKKTLAMGLYLRFRKENADAPKYSSSYIKQNPLEFERFVADVFEKSRGGSTWVSRASGDYGVDFEQTVNDELYLGQVKCYQGDLSYEPIALVHSNMVKRNAQGGYVITTGSFTTAARAYAKGLNVELIDGVKLIDIWLMSVNHNEQEIRKIIPEFN